VHQLVIKEVSVLLMHGVTMKYVAYLGFDYLMVLHVLSYFNVARTKGAFFFAVQRPTRSQVTSFLRFRFHIQIYHTQ